MNAATVHGSNSNSARMRSAVCGLLVVSAITGCAELERLQKESSKATTHAAAGAAIGAAAGNVIGYLTRSDRTTTTVIGALVGGGLGYWQGLQADKKLERAQTVSHEIAQEQSSQTKYAYEQPKLYARETVQEGQKVATFDKMETSMPPDAVKQHSTEASGTLRKLGAFAARNNSAVSVYAPEKSMRDYMSSELRKGAAGNILTITTVQSAETRVVVGAAPE